MADIERVRIAYRRFADNECRGYSDHYELLSREIADDAWLCKFIARMPVIQPNLFLAALQFLLGPEAMPVSAADARQFVQSNLAAVEHLLRERRTQTNEVGRCAAILPALPPGPLAILEVGASAGLCLLLDQYGYQYASRRVGPADAAVQLRCRETPNTPVPTQVPKIVWRRGIDLNPLEAHDSDDARWLLSCVWPDHIERRQRLAAALEHAKLQSLPLVRGDLVDLFPTVSADAPTGVPLVVFHTAVLAYLIAVRRQEFADMLLAESQKRDILWISNESPTVVPEITALATSRPALRILLGRTTLSRGQRRDELLAFTHPHGAELNWLE